MIEVAIASFGLSLDAARNLTIYEYRLHRQAQARRYRDEHTRDLQLAWMIATMTNNPIPFRQLQRLMEGRGSDEMERGEQLRTAAMLQFEQGFQEELAATAANKEGGHGG